MGGAEYQAMLIARGLADIGHEILFIATYSSEISSARLGNLRICNLQNWEIVGLKEFRRSLWKTVETYSPDLCYVRRFKDISFIAHICASLGIDFVSASSHSSETNPILRTRYLREFFRHLQSFISISASSMHVCNTHTLQKEIRRWYPKHSMLTIYNGQPVPPQNTSRNGSNGQIIWVNNLKPWKRPELFVDLARFFPKYSFVMVGQIPSNRFGIKIGEKLKAAPTNLEFIGSKPIEVVNQLISQSDLLVYTSRPMEGFANSFLQAWFRGVPTLSLDYSLDGILERERVGRCAEDFDQLVSDVDELMIDENQRREMGNRARDYAAQNHTLDTLISNYESLFNEILV
jgi:glycosyltransferase involved in cell wall biosynthesis